MSMIENQVKELRELADKLAMYYSDKDSGVVTQAADTIESLSAKLSAANMERAGRHNDSGGLLARIGCQRKERQ